MIQVEESIKVDTYLVTYEYKGDQRSLVVSAQGPTDALVAANISHNPSAKAVLHIAEITPRGFLSRTTPLSIPKTDEQYLLSVAADVDIRVYWQESQDARVHERFRDWGIADQMPEDIIPNKGEGQWSLSTRLAYPVLDDGTFPTGGALPSSGELQNVEFVLGLLQLGVPGERPFKITNYTHAEK